MKKRAGGEEQEASSKGRNGRKGKEKLRQKFVRRTKDNME